MLRKFEVPCAPVLSMKEIANDPALREPAAPWSRCSRRSRGSYLTVGSPMKFSGFTPKITGAPLLGEHTAEVLTELGYDADTIAEFHEEQGSRLNTGRRPGVFGAVPPTASCKEPTDNGGSKRYGRGAPSEIAAGHRADRGGLLPILHAVQEAHGIVCHRRPSPCWRMSSTFLVRTCTESSASTGMSVPNRPGAPAVRVCRAEACQAVGAERLVAHLRDRYRVSLGETTLDGSLTAEQVFCLGGVRAGACRAGERPAPRPAGRGRLSLIIEEAVSQ